MIVRKRPRHSHVDHGRFKFQVERGGGKKPEKPDFFGNKGGNMGLGALTLFGGIMLFQWSNSLATQIRLAESPALRTACGALGVLIAVHGIVNIVRAIIQSKK